MSWIDEALRGVNPDDVDSISVKIRNPKARPRTEPVPEPEPEPAPVPEPTPTPSEPLGIPYGMLGAFKDASGVKPGYTNIAAPGGPFTAGSSYADPSGLITLINTARANKLKLVTYMTGGSHSQYTTNGKFDLAKWKARQTLFDTPTLRTAVAAAVADGTYLCDSMLDEPEHGDWGGAVTPAMLDEMSRFVHAIFPTLPTAVAAKLEWQPNAVYRDLNYMIRQFAWGGLFGNTFVTVDDYRDRAIALAEHSLTGLIFSTNILDGGDRITGCPIPQTGGPGTFGTNCRQRPDQIESAVEGLTRRGCAAMLMWREDAGYTSNAEMMAAAARSAALLATRPQRYVERPA